MAYAVNSAPSCAPQNQIFKILPVCQYICVDRMATNWRGPLEYFLSALNIPAVMNFASLRARRASHNLERLGMSEEKQPNKGPGRLAGTLLASLERFTFFIIVWESLFWEQ
jgi:hypothetical protein